MKVEETGKSSTKRPHCESSLPPHPNDDFDETIESAGRTIETESN